MSKTERLKNVVRDMQGELNCMLSDVEDLRIAENEDDFFDNVFSVRTCIARLVRDAGAAELLIEEIESDGMEVAE